MIHYAISKHAKILFVGINPHYGSFRRGVPFSNNKMFWYLLARSRIIREDLKALRNDEQLKRIYSEKFKNKYRLNFVNLVNRPTHDVSQLRKGEELSGVRRVNKLIRENKPRVVCFIGKITYEKFSNTKQFSFGLQKDINYSKVYVMHFPIRGPASTRIKELKEVSKMARLRTN
ncbi:MAG: uracil-DNA glycosylase family protein [Candidatus Micrarchaeaceae archaeon]